MAAPLYLDLPSLVPRLILWLVLWVGMAFIGFLYREARGRGYSLFYATGAVVTSYVLENSLALAYAQAYDAELADVQGDSPHAVRLFGAYIFFDDLSETMLIALLLLVSAGFCITRDNLGPDRNKVIGFPIIYLATALAFDYTVYIVVGRAPFDAANDSAISVEELAPGEDLALFLCAIVNLMVLLFSWMLMMESLKRERESLNTPAPEALETQMTSTRMHTNPLAAQILEGDVSSRGGDSEGGTKDNGAPVRPDGSGSEAGAGSDAEMATMQAVEMGVDENVLDEGPSCGGAAGPAGGDGQVTVEAALANGRKLTLLRGFSWGITFYIISNMCVFLLPLFFDDDERGHDQGVHILLVAQNYVLWVFMVALAIVFRPKPNNMYLMLDDDGAEFSTALGVEDAARSDARV